jgi:hypothetical protein
VTHGSDAITRNMYRGLVWVHADTAIGFLPSANLGSGVSRLFDMWATDFALQIADKELVY